MVPKKHIITKKINLLYTVLVSQKKFYVYVEKTINVDVHLNNSLQTLFSNLLKIESIFQSRILRKKLVGSKNSFLSSLYFFTLMFSLGDSGDHFFLMFISNFHMICECQKKNFFCGLQNSVQ